MKRTVLSWGRLSTLGGLLATVFVGFTQGQTTRSEGSATAPHQEAVGGSLELDLGIILDIPLLTASLTDEGVLVQTRRGRVFAILPFRYRQSKEEVEIDIGDVTVAGDTGSRYPVRGVLLIDQGPDLPADEAQERGVRPLMPATDQMREAEPLWERITIPPAPKNQGEVNAAGRRFEIRCFNTRRPPEAVSAGKTRSQEGIRSQNRKPLLSRMEERMGTGAAAFVVEIPDSVKVLEVTHRQGLLAKSQLETRWLELLSVSGELTAERVEALGRLAAEAPAPVAQRAISRLVELGLPEETRGDTSSRAPRGQIEASTVLKALMNATGHKDRMVQEAARQALASGLVNDELTAVRLAGGVKTASDPAMAQQILAAVEYALAGLPRVQPQLPTRNPSWAQPLWPSPSATGRSRRPGEPESVRSSSDHWEASMQGLARTGQSAATESLRLSTILSAGLQSQNAEVQARALEVVLRDGTYQSVGLLVRAKDAQLRSIAAMLSKIGREEVRECMIRFCLINPNSGTTKDALAAAAGLAFTVSSCDDPLLSRLDDPDPRVVEKLLGILQRASFAVPQEIGGCLSGYLTRLEGFHGQDAAVRSALLEVALAHMELPYDAPVWQPWWRSGPTNPQEFQSPFASFLGSLAAKPTTPDRDACRAARALLRAGQIGGLVAWLPPGAAEERGRVILGDLADEKLGCSALEAMGLLVSWFFRGGYDDGTVNAALRLVDRLERTLDGQQRARFDLGLRLGLVRDPLICLVDTDFTQRSKLQERRREVSPLASQLVKRLEQAGGMSIDSPRTSVPAATDPLPGRYACMVYLQVERRPAEAKIGQATVLPVADPRIDRLLNRLHTPLYAGEVTFERGSDGSVRVMASGQELDAMPVGQSREPDPKAVARTGLVVNTGPLLYAALNSQDATNEGLRGQVNLLPLAKLRMAGRQVAVDLSSSRGNVRLDADVLAQPEHDGFGVWSGDLVLSDSFKAAEEDRPLRVQSSTRVAFVPIREQTGAGGR